MFRKENILLFRILIIGIAVLIALNARAQSSAGYIINGIIADGPDGLNLHLVRIVDNKYDTVATRQLKSGRFHFFGKLLHEGEFYRIMRDSSKTKKDFIPIFLDNSEISINLLYGEWPKAIIKGSKSHSEWIAVKHVIDSLITEREIIGEAIKKLDTTDSVTFNKLNKSYNISLIQEQKNVILNFINKNPDSFYSAFLLTGRALSLEEKIASFERMSAKTRNSFYGVEVKKILGARPGQPVYNFTSNTPDGRKLSVNQFVFGKKLTLIDFWASWCVPCRKEIPNIKKVYERFHKYGFNVLGVSLDTKRQDWLKAIRDEGLPWENVSELRGRNETGAVLYQLDGIPAFLLIDGKGKIISLDLPGSKIPSTEGGLRGEALYKKVEEYFKRLKD